MEKDDKHDPLDNEQAKLAMEGLDKMKRFIADRNVSSIMVTALGAGPLDSQQMSWAATEYNSDHATMILHQVDRLKCDCTDPACQTNGIRDILHNILVAYLAGGAIIEMTAEHNTPSSTKH